MSELKLNCIRCGNPMSEHAVYNGLQELEKTGDGFKLVMDKSLPVLPFICESCGYVELRIPSLIGK